MKLWQRYPIILMNIAEAILTIFYGRRIPTEDFVPCRRGKKTSGVRFFFLSETFGRFWLFLDRKTTDVREKIDCLLSMSEKKIK